jgi:hypothetical protein
MLIKTKIDISGALVLTDLILKKLPYATNNALTRTARELVNVEQQALRSEFQIRKEFILNRVQITKYSRPESLWVEVSINKNVQGGELLLTMFEEGGEKLPDTGTELAVALTGAAARPSFAANLRNSSLFYQKLNMQRHVTELGKIQYKGDQRTFVIPGVGIFQRNSSRKRRARAKPGQAAGPERDATLIYSFKRAVPLRAQMHFVQTARSFVLDRFSVVWREEFVKELAGRARR